mmetsp:Transcript_32136/g.92857  ORF Transcript_32136/g.92857 Transcript_32136/m.92857 type:complete len:217 (+) Transcript_32136:538-1188(+)
MLEGAHLSSLSLSCRVELAIRRPVDCLLCLQHGLALQAMCLVVQPLRHALVAAEMALHLGSIVPVRRLGGGGAAAAPAASATPSLPLPSLPFGFTCGLLPSREPRVIILHTPHRSSPVDCTTSPRRSCFHGCRRQNTPPVPQAWYFGSAAAAISPTGCEQQPALIAAFTSVRCSASSGQALGTAFRQPAGHSEVSKRSTPPASKISSFNRSMVNGV